ncbi:MAG: type III-A CRISPR-associated RAMP protein Csm4 [Fusobacteriaceae bacterium]|jgi:CRISPR-associated protein Csm4|nr:type III-A CRISPR-associated RAMP protein Csm4 [Fusobacteriaceae bacterium]
MEYKTYRFEFDQGVHIGKDSLEDGAYSLCSDTIFSAICIEALKNGGEDNLINFVNLCKNNDIKISDGFPFIGQDFYIPKPIYRIEKQEDGNSKQKKLYKKLSYIKSNSIVSYLEGKLNPQLETNDFKKLGKYSINAKVNLSGEDKNNLFNVGSYHFHDGKEKCYGNEKYDRSGIYIIVGVSKIEYFEYIDELLDQLSYSGIGGKRTAGYGRFVLKHGKLENEFLANIDKKHSKKYILLSTAMAKKEELDNVLTNAQYQLIKRSGFVLSDTYSKSPLKKKDFYSFKSGSIFESYFEGDIFDVSNNGGHPVYRYAKSLFLGVD